MGAASSVLGPLALPSLRVEWELPVATAEVEPQAGVRAAGGSPSIYPPWSASLEGATSFASFATLDGRALGHAAARLPVMLVQHGPQMLAISPLNGEAQRAPLAIRGYTAGSCAPPRFFFVVVVERECLVVPPTHSLNLPAPLPAPSLAQCSRWTGRAIASRTRARQGPARAGDPAS
jgi:hypothetical protein